MAKTAAARGKNNRVRGFDLERAVVKEAKQRGLTATRSWGSDGRAAGHAKEVDVTIGLSNIELRGQCKRKKRITGDYKPEPGIEFQVFRADHEDAFVSVRLTDFLSLVNSYLRLRAAGVPVEGDAPVGIATVLRGTE